MLFPHTSVIIPCSTATLDFCLASELSCIHGRREILCWSFYAKIEDSLHFSLLAGNLEWRAGSLQTPSTAIPIESQSLTSSLNCG
jgi:hypothetical protein